MSQRAVLEEKYEDATMARNELQSLKNADDVTRLRSKVEEASREMNQEMASKYIAELAATVKQRSLNAPVFSFSSQKFRMKWGTTRTQVLRACSRSTICP